MKDNKTWTPAVIIVFLHIHCHEQSTLPNLLNLKNQPIETIQSTHKSPLSNPQTTGVPSKVQPPYPLVSFTYENHKPSTQ